MRRRVFTWITLAVSAAVFLSGCGGNGKKKGDVKNDTEKVYRDSFTEEEKKSGHAEFELAENISVNADITPMEKYENGLACYYMEDICEPGDFGKKESFIKNASIYGQPLEDAFSLISEKMEGKFDQDSFAWDLDFDGEIILKGSFQKKNEDILNLFADWEEKKEKNGPFLLYIEKEGYNSQMPADVRCYVENYESEDISFLENKQETGEKLREFLEQFTGRKISGEWECVPVTEDIAAGLKKSFQEEYCEYRFFYDVAGLPFRSMSLNYTLKDGETAAEASKVSVPEGSKTLMGLNMGNQYIGLDKDGMIRLYVNNYRREGNVWREAASVIEPGDVLRKLEAYYEKQVVFKPVAVTEVSLCYSGYFAPDKEGLIVPAVCPYWIVRAYDGMKESHVYFVYDAFTGECMWEGVSGSQIG